MLKNKKAENVVLLFGVELFIIYIFYDLLLESEEWLGITWQGQFDLSNGSLAGLQTIHRVGEALIEVDGLKG